MRKTLYIICLSAMAFSCTTQKPVQKKTTVVKKTTPTVNPAPVAAVSTKPTIAKDHGVEFYRQNIGDITKNDNTASYGSLVSAKPKGYNIVKNYFPALAQNFRQRFLILHYTALDHDKSINVLTNQAVSSHYLVNDLADNEIYQLVDENKRAYHSGISTWRKDKNLNDNSIGIEIVNAGYTTDSSGKKIFVPFSEEQIKKVAALCKDIIERYNIPPTNFLAHSDIAPTRKQDPGPLFPWKKLYQEYGIGMWYDEESKQSFMNQLNPEIFVAEQNTASFVFKVQTLLQQFGYDINPSGTWDKENIKVVEAFQYHFRPHNYDGVVDMETWAILQALLQKYPSK